MGWEGGGREGEGEGGGIQDACQDSCLTVYEAPGPGPHLEPVWRGHALGHHLVQPAGLQVNKLEAVRSERNRSTSLVYLTSTSVMFLTSLRYGRRISSM